MTESTIQMAHGAGGEMMQGLIRDLVLKHFGTDGKAGGMDVEVPLNSLDDGATVGDWVFTIDAHTVRPLFYPGGDMGKLSACGTINDLAVMGARPLALALSMVIEEGFPITDLDRMLESLQEVCRQSDVRVITGDTKVVEKGGVEGVVFTTAGFGMRHPMLDLNLQSVRKERKFEGRWPRDSAVAPGDMIIVSGSVGDHGAALMSHREGYSYSTELRSDTAALANMLGKALEAGGVTAMKDPTRGGLSNALNEWASKSGHGILLFEDRVPVRQEVRSIGELLGIDPYEVGNEGKAILAVVPEHVDGVLEAIRETPEGAEAAIIGEVTDEVTGVVLETIVGGRRIVDPPVGDPVPRIC